MNQPILLKASAVPAQNKFMKDIMRSLKSKGNKIIQFIFFELVEVNCFKKSV